LFYQKRARKKKSLTDFVELISFPGQATSDASKQIAPQTKVPIVSISQNLFKKEVKQLDKPVGNFKSNLLSINEIIKTKENTDQDIHESHDDKPRNNFSLDELKIFWRKFAYRMKDEGNDTIYLAMKKRDPKLTSDFLVIHEVDNQVQIDYIQAHLSDLTNYLRENLKNWGINLQFSLSETTEESIQLLTGKDKFHALARKNPNLYTLQKTFNLDINY
jgi:hypothetical protein